ncbi:MAG: isopentenyl phosphate kinase [Candidatus ainarchaeum sp.]|nr:isopentenyl phosphate kinase [Candidatus ainarchaeum sp.]
MMILKLGGSVITKKFDYLETDDKNIEYLARAIGSVWDPKMELILIHGAGSFGHAPVLAHGLHSGIKTKKQVLGFADTHSSCSYLSNFIADRLIKSGVPAVVVSPVVVIRQINGRISKFDTSTVFELLKKGYLPVMHGDMVLDSKLGGSICSGDQISTYLGKKAKKIIFGTNVDGVMANGKLVEKITKNNFKDIEKHLKSSSAPDVTGGMAGKVKEIISSKKSAYIVNALKPKRIEDLLKGRTTICTEINVK